MLTELSPLLTADEAGEILGHHPRTVLRLARSGQIPSVRLGHRTLRFKSEDLAAFIDAHRTAIGA